MAVRIDSDSHFLPRDVFDDVDPRFEHRRPRVYFDAVGRSAATYPDRESRMSHHQRYVLPNTFLPSRRPAGFWEVGPRLEFMDRTGLDLQVLVPSNPPFHWSG